MFVVNTEGREDGFIQFHFAASTFPHFSITRDTSYMVLAFKENKELHFTAVSSLSSCLAGNSRSSSARDRFITRPSAKYFQWFERFHIICWTKYVKITQDNTGRIAQVMLSNASQYTSSIEHTICKGLQYDKIYISGYILQDDHRAVINRQSQKGSDRSPQTDDVPSTAAALPLCTATAIHRCRW